MVDLQLFASEGGDAAAPSAPALSHAQAQQAIASGTMKADEGRKASDVPTPAAVQEPEERPAPPERPAPLPLPPIPGPVSYTHLDVYKRQSFARIGHTLRHLPEDKQVFWFLLAFFCYIDGVYTIIDMATAYGTALGLDTTGMCIRDRSWRALR